MASEVLTAAGAVKIVITGEGANFSSVMADANRQLDKLGLKGKEAGHQMVTSVQAASGTIRLLEGDITRNVRAVEKFVTMIPGVGAALKVAFPVVGALALGGVIARLAEQVQKFLKDMKEGPDKVRDGFMTMTLSAMTANDELRKNNDELAKQISKIEGKPVNNLALALDEARIQADNLQRSLDGAYQEQKKLLEETKAGFWEQVLGKGATDEVQGNIENFFKQIRDAERNANAALHSSDTAGAAKYQALVSQLQQNAIAYANTEITQRSSIVEERGGKVSRVIGPGDMAPTSLGPDAIMGSYSALNGDQSKNLEALKGMRDLMYQQQDRAQLQAINSQRTGQLAGLEGQKGAAAAQMQKWREQLEAEKAVHTMTVDDEAAYWQKLADTAKRGSMLYNSALMEANKARAESVKQYQQAFVSGVLQSQEAQRAAQEASERVSAAVAEQYTAQDTRDREAAKQVQDAAIKAFEAAEQERRAADRIAEEAIKLREASGQLSHAGAAQALATVHQESFAAWSASATDFSAKFPNTALPGAAQATKDFGLQSAQDEAARESATALGALHESADKLTQSFLDLPVHVQELLTSTVNGFNGAISSAVLAHSTSGIEYRRGITNAIGGQFRSAGSRGLDTALQLGEGGLLSKLGFGKKADGSQSNPFWVRVAGMGVGTSGGEAIGPSLLSSLGAFGAAGSSGKSSGSFLSTVMPALTAMLPHFASGGPIPSNMPAIVGENGPELFMPSSSGRIVPNDALGASGGGHTFNIDARGSTDPAATEFAVRRGMNEVLRQVPGLAIAGLREYNRGRPATSRV
jgi:hypothetical protein